METLLQDLRFALRALGKNPGFSAIAILTLALGIGANTALFSVINAVLLRTLPIRDAQQLVVISDPQSSGMQNGTSDGERNLFTYHEFEGMRDQNTVFSGLFTFSSQTYSAPVYLGSTDENSPTNISMVSGGYFPTLEVDAQMGHTFGMEVDQGRNAHPVALLSYSYWDRKLQRDPSVIGRKIHIRKGIFEIVGVMPPEFTGLMVGDAPDIWIPLMQQDAIFPIHDLLTQKPGSITKTMFLHIVGRMKPGVTLAQANASINVTFKQVQIDEAASIPDEKERQEITNSYIVTHDGSRGLSTLRGQYAEPLKVLMGLVGLLLLLACANVANLLLARASGRQRELAVRVALGAGRGRLIRQLLTESVLLAGLGAAVGLLLARWGDRLLLRMVSSGPTTVPLDVHLDFRVLAFAIGVTLITGILFGLAPALRSTRVDLNQVLRGSSRTISGGAGRGAGRVPLGRVLVATQVAISLLLLVSAGLFVRSLQKLTSVPLGYDAGHLLLFRMIPASNGYKPGATGPLFQQLQAKFATIPGVTGATLSENGLFFNSDSGDEISIVGYTPKSGQKMDSSWDQVGPNYFSTVGIPVLMGRDVQPRDAIGSKVCWVNQTFAKYYFGNDNPIGRHIRDEYPEDRQDLEIVGVVADARYNGLRGEIPRRFYVPFFNPVEPSTQAVFEIHYVGDGASVTASLRQVVHETDGTLDPLEIRTIAERIDQRLVRDRLTAKLSTFFGILALLMACIGLYGVLSYTVSQRTGELGVRMALGAQRANVLWLILREALAVTILGAAVGLAAALAVTRVMTSLLYDLTGHDPLTLTVAAAVLLVVATLAALLPALRASQTDPMTALRYE
jgi:predicted permease